MKAYTAVWDLTAGGDKAVRWLRKTWKPAFQHERANRLLADLGADEFAVREKARRELEEMAEDVEPLLDALLQTPVSAEVKRAVKRLLARLETVSAERLRQLRTLTVLERIGTTEARRLLQELSKRQTGTHLREQARLAEARLAFRLAK